MDGSSFKTDIASTRLRYMQVADDLRRRIGEGEFAPGHIIPGERELAQKFSVSRASIRRAIEVLDEEGILERRPSVGSIVKRASKNKIVVGYFVDDLTSLFHMEIMKHLIRLLAERNAGLIVSEGVSSRRLVEMGATRIVKCSGLAGTAAEDSVPTVYIGSEPPSSARVMSDDRAGLRLVFGHLRELGHERIGYYGPGEMGADKRFTALAEAMAEHGLTIRDADLFKSSMPADKVVGILRWRMDSGDIPTALVCFDDETAIRVMRYARLTGLDVPGRLSITGFDDIPVSGMLDVPLTTVAFPALEIAEKIIRILLGSKFGQPVIETVAAKLVVRSSTAPACIRRTMEEA